MPLFGWKRLRTNKIFVTCSSVFILWCTYTYYQNLCSTFVIRRNNLDTEFRLTYSYGNSSYNGIPFEKKWNVYLQNLKLLNVENRQLDDMTLQSTPIIGTAVSSNHFNEMKNLLRSLQKVYKGTKMVYVYDLGLSEQERKSLTSEFAALIYELRNFTFEKYPSYFRNLRGFRWKPIVVAELLAQFPSVWWMDSSVQVNQPLNHFYRKINSCFNTSITSCYYSYWRLITPSSHSIFAATDDVMYEYFPMPKNFTKHLTMWQATIQLIFGTKKVKENLLRYWVLCALEQECMEPSNSTIVCQFGPDRRVQYAGCHRQDQSAINIILAANNNFNDHRYSEDGDGVIDIVRSK